MTRYVFEPIFPPLHSLPKKRFHAIFLKEVFSSITILQSEWFTKHEINVFFFMRRHKNKMRNRSTFKGRLGNAKFDQLAMNSGLLQGKETVLWVAPANWFVWLEADFSRADQFETSTFPSPGNQRAFDCRLRRRLVSLNLGRVWWEVSSIPSRTHVFFLLMWRFFKVKSSLSWAGSERKVYKVWVLKLGQCEEGHGRWFCPVWKIDSQIRLLGEHLNSIWPRGWQEFERTNLQKLKCPKGCSGVAQGVLKLRTDGHIDHKHKVNAKNISKKMA